MVDHNTTRGTVTLGVDEYENLLRLSGQGGAVGELPNNDGLRPLEKIEDAQSITNSEQDALVPVVKNQGRAPKKRDPKNVSENVAQDAVKEGTTVSEKDNLDTNEYLAGRSMEKVPVVVADPRVEEHSGLKARIEGSDTK